MIMLQNAEKALIQNLIFLLLLLAYLLVMGEGKISRDEIKQMIMKVKQNTKHIGEGKAAEKSEKIKKGLPNGDLFAAGLQVKNLECGASYPVDAIGYLFFRLSPSKQSCDYSFMGSWKAGCTVAMLCKGKISLAPANAENVCEKEYLQLSDGTEGEMRGCGNFTFGGKPRISRSNASDLYVAMKGTSQKRCIVFCLEDLGEGRPGIKEVHRLTAKKNWKGLEMEKDCNCGKRRNVERVVGGENALKFEFPWIGSIVFDDENFRRYPYCGGSLINDRYFITAAHCVKNQEKRPQILQVLLHHHVMDKTNPAGTTGNEPEFQNIPGWNLKDETDESEESYRMAVEEIIVHPLFNDRTFDYDIALVKFKTPLELKSNKKVSPICLPEIVERFMYQDGTNMVVAGWGRPWETAKATSRIPQKLDLPFVNDKKCQDYSIPARRHLCAGYIEGGKDACSGDSGGPLIYKFDVGTNSYFLSGIVSAGDGCARKDRLGVYTDVQELVQWVYMHSLKGKWCAREK